MPFARQPRYEVLSKERIEGPLDFMEVKKLVESGHYALNDSLREQGRSEWESMRVALQRDKKGAIISLPIFGMLFFTAGVLLVWSCLQSLALKPGFGPPSHALGGFGVIMIAVGVGLGMLAYNIHTAPLGKLPRKMSRTEVALYWGGLIAGLIIVLQLP